MVDKVALEQVFLRVLRFFPVNLIPLVLHYTEKRRKLIIFITGLHKKPQGCGASVASAAGPSPQAGAGGGDIINTNQCSDRDWNRTPTEYMHEALWLKLISSVSKVVFFYWSAKKNWVDLMFLQRCCWRFKSSGMFGMGRESSVGIATCYALDGLRFELQWVRDFPQPFGPSLVLIQWVNGLVPVVEPPKARRWPPTPTSTFTPSSMSMACYGATFTFTFRITRHYNFGGW
jgi:hypothetical protein